MLKKSFVFIALLCSVVGAPQSRAAQGEKSTQDLPVIKWGADSEGGAPYIFQNPKDPQHIIGFEVDFVEALAREMGMRPVNVQNQWDALVPGLNRGNYDLVVNGLEITEDRKAEVAFSAPYYLTYEQIIVHQDDNEITSLEDARGKAVGTLKGTLAERILMSRGDIDVRGYEDDVNGLGDIINGRISAVMMDAPMALYYAKPNPQLKLVGKPIGRVAYGVGVRKSDPILLMKVNQALDRLIKTGKLREIFERWALWSPINTEYFKTQGAPEAVSPLRAPAYEEFLEATGKARTWRDTLKQYTGFFPMLMTGALRTLELTLAGMILAVTFGLVLALTRLYGPKPLSILSIVYIEVVRGTPLLIQLFLIFYGLPNLGIKLSPFVAAFLGLGLNYAAYEAENYRAGIQAISHGQMDAASALGMSRFQALRFVIIPQALRIVIPPVTNDFISLLKDSSLVSVITMVELTKVYGQLATTYQDYLGIGVVTAAIYFLMGLPFVRLAQWAERHYSFDKRQPVKAVPRDVWMPLDPVSR